MKSLADGIQDLIQEAKLRTVWWMLCIFVVTYFLTRKHVFLHMRNHTLQFFKIFSSFAALVMAFFIDQCDAYL